MDKETCGAPTNNWWMKVLIVLIGSLMKDFFAGLVMRRRQKACEGKTTCERALVDMIIFSIDDERQT